MADSKKSEVLESLRYFQGFHHTCIGWYITVFGIFIAGGLASPVPEKNTNQAIGWIVIISTILVSFSFFLCIGHYAARIKKLGGYLCRKEEDIPDDWYERASNVSICFSGKGSWFFLFLLFALQITFLFIAILKYVKC